MLRPAKFDYILSSQYLIDRPTQEMHAWNPDDRSLNIFVKDDDCFTFHRHPVAQSTDCIRGKMGYSTGFHVWQLEWPPTAKRGPHNALKVVGVATKAAALHAMGYTSLIGTNTESYGWDLTRGECHHDSKNCSPWQYPTGVPMRPDYTPIPDKFYCILDMDDGYMAFATDQHYLGVAFRNLQGKTLYPIVSAVWGHCEITMKYLGGIEPRGECHHDSKNCSPWQYPTGVPMRPDYTPIPDKFYCILDMDDGYMAFATDQHYLGVAFRNLQGKTLYPIVSAVWGHCEITMKYLGGIERERPQFEPLPFSPILRANPSWEMFSPDTENVPEKALIGEKSQNLGIPFDPRAPPSVLLPPPTPAPRPLMDICRRAIRVEMGRHRLHRVDELRLPPPLKRFILYRK
ncbi:SPRY domain protein [Cooperia oncophora]